MRAYGMRLFDHHQELLDASGVDVEVARERGYRSVDTKAGARRLGFSAAQAGDGLLIPLWGVDGKVAGYQLRRDEPRVGKTGKPVKYETPFRQRALLDVHPRARAGLADPNVPLWVTEGSRKADAAVSRGLCCISVAGVWNWRGTNSEGGKALLADWESVALSGSNGSARTVYLAFDSDVMTKPEVHRALSRLSAVLTNRSANVLYVYLPDKDDGSKTGLDDYLAAGHGVDELVALASPVLRRPAIPVDGLPEIIVDGRQMRHVTADAIAALEEANDPPVVFRRGTAWTRLRSDVDEPHLEPMNQAAVRGRLARVANWFQSGEDGPIPTPPPNDVVADVLGLPEVPAPPLDRIVTAPVFGADGVLQTEPGYHYASRTFYVSDGAKIPDVPEAPTAAELDRARVLLVEDLLGDFPFVDPAEQAHAVALLLLPFARDLIDGPTPLHLVEAPSPGTGKSLMVTACLLPALGDSVAVMSEGRAEDEWRKRITSQLLRGPSAVWIDNLRYRLDTASLSAVLTTGWWEDRILGVSRIDRMPVRCAWVATGNNPALSSEIARRTVRIRLDAAVDQPWLRTGWRHPGLRGWGSEHRGDLIHAALVLIQGWLAAGRPPGTATLGMFEDWARVLGGILGHAGIAGFLDNLKAFYEVADAERLAWGAFFEQWWSMFGDNPKTASELFALTEVVDLYLGGSNEQGRRVSFGRGLAAQRDRRSGRFHVTSVGTAQRAVRWKLVLREDSARHQSEGSGSKETHSDSPDSPPEGECRESGESETAPDPEPGDAHAPAADDEWVDV